MITGHRSSGTYHHDRWNEAFFSLNLAFVSVSLIFLVAPRIYRPFVDIEVWITRNFLRLPSTDLARGYFAHWIAGAVLALLFWIVLRLLSRTRIASELSMSSGVVAFCSAPVFWFFLGTMYGWYFDVRFWVGLLELPVVLTFALLVIKGRLRLAWYSSVLLIVAHCLLWFWITGNMTVASYIGPAGPILSFCSATAWWFHIKTAMPVHGE